MSRCPHILLPALLLTGCDRSEPVPSPKGRGNADVVALAPGRASIAPEEPAASPAALRRDLENALALQSPSAREKTIADVAWNALETDPELAVEAFKHLPSGSPEKNRLLQHYAMRASEEDLEESLAWAGGLESDQERSAAYSRIAVAMAETDPVGAAKLLAEYGKPGRDLDVAVVQVVQRWAGQNPAAVADWLAMFPAGPAREAGIKVTAARWLGMDARAAFAWLAGIKDAGVRQEAALGLEEAILQQTPETRESWLRHADGGILAELARQRERAIEGVGDNLLAPPEEK